jgi:hypothetical protein
VAGSRLATSVLSSRIVLAWLWFRSRLSAAAAG